MMAVKIKDSAVRMLSPRELLSRAARGESVRRLRIARNVLPGGYMASLKPVLRTRHLRATLCTPCHITI